MQFSAPVDAEKEPAAQTEHDVAPMTGLYDPKPQSAQRTLPSLAVNLPFGHVWQMPSTEEKAVPLGQPVHEALPNGRMKPAGQLKVHCPLESARTF